MRVDLPNILPQSTQEKSAKSTGPSDGAVPEAFFAHMDRILNPEEEGDVDQKGNGRDQKPDIPGDNFLNCMLAVNVFPMPMPAVPSTENQTASSPVSGPETNVGAMGLWAQNGDAELIPAAPLMTESSGMEMEPFPGVKSEEHGDLQTAAPGQQAVDRKATPAPLAPLAPIAADSSLELSADSTGSVPDLSLDPSGQEAADKFAVGPDPSRNAAAAENFQNIPTREAADTREHKAPEEMLEISGHTAQEDLHFRKEVILDNLQKVIQPQAVDSYRQGILPTDSLDALSHPNDLAELLSNEKSAALQTTNSPVENGKKPNIEKPPELKTSVPDLEPSDRGKQPASPIAMQGKIENGPSDFTRAKGTGTENQRESFTQYFGAAAQKLGTNSAITAAETAAPLQNRELLFELAERIQVQLREGKGEIRIQLKPDSLGSLEIRAESTTSGVVASIAAESAQVKTYLENNLHLLQQNLQDQGLKVDRIQIFTQDGLDPQFASGHSAHFGDSGSGQHGRQDRDTLEQGFVPAAPTEELPVDPAGLSYSNQSSRFHRVA
jgi:flagellar hook-length control protein FliK